MTTTTPRLSSSVRLAAAASLAASLALGACTGDDPIDVTTLTQSQEIWDAERDTHDGNYSYARVGQGLEPRFYTAFVVQNNEVVSRQYLPDRDLDPTAEGWIETGAELGSHEWRHEVLTIDELYDVCATEFLTRSASEYDIQLTFHEDTGILETCHANPLDCEDCIEGVDIDTIEIGPGPCGVADNGSKVCG